MGAGQSDTEDGSEEEEEEEEKRPVVTRAKKQQHREAQYLFAEDRSPVDSTDKKTRPPSTGTKREKQSSLTRYFEKQQALKCGLHAINNLLVPVGRTRVTEIQLHNEACHLLSKAWQNNLPLELQDYCTPKGEYQCELIVSMLQRNRQCHAERVRDGLELETLFVTPCTKLIIGWLVCNNHHWWAVRPNSGVWEVVDSLKETPSRLEDPDLLWQWLDVDECTILTVTPM